MKTIKAEYLDKKLYANRERTSAIVIRDGDKDKELTIRDYFKMQIDQHKPEGGWSRQTSKTIDGIYDALASGDFSVDDADAEYLKKVLEKAKIEIKTMFDDVMAALDSMEA